MTWNVRLGTCAFEGVPRKACLGNDPLASGEVLYIAGMLEVPNFRIILIYLLSPIILFSLKQSTVQESNHCTRDVNSPLLPLGKIAKGHFFKLVSFTQVDMI